MNSIVCHKTQQQHHRKQSLFSLRLREGERTPPRPSCLNPATYESLLVRCDAEERRGGQCRDMTNYLDKVTSLPRPTPAPRALLCTPVGEVCMEERRGGLCVLGGVM